VIATARRALAQLRHSEPTGLGDQILVETAKEEFEALIRASGGEP
jgi:uncharacterized membrane protein